MRILMVSFLYPPFSSITGLGASKMSRYLFERGWDVRVLCGRHDDVPADLSVELPHERVTRTESIDVNAIPKTVLGRSHVQRRGFEFQRSGLLTLLGRAYRNIVNFPDAQIGWYPRAVGAGSDLIRRARPDVILGVGTPWTSFLVARALSRRFSIPWVARYHDLWTDSMVRGRIWPLGALERRLEDRTTSSAALIVTVSDAWRDHFAARFPSVAVAVTPFGFEPNDYGDVPARAGLPLELVYTGRLYDRQDPGKLFTAVRTLLERHVVTPDEVRIRFVGRYLDVARMALARARLPADVIQIGDPLPHADVPALQQAASALVLFLGEDEDVGLLPAKMYEYLGARRPILVIGGTDRHEAVQKLRRARVASWAAEPRDVSEVLSRWVGTLRTGGRLEVRPDPDVLRQYEWRSTAETMSALLRETVTQGRSRSGFPAACEP